MSQSSRVFYKSPLHTGYNPPVKYIPDIASFGTNEVLLKNISLIIKDIRQKKESFDKNIKQMKSSYSFSFNDKNLQGQLITEYDKIKKDEARMLIVELIKRLPAYKNELFRINIRDDSLINMYIVIYGVKFLLVLNFEDTNIIKLNAIYSNNVSNFRVFATGISECLNYNDINSLESFSCLFESLINTNITSISYEPCCTILFDKIVNSKFPLFILKAAVIWDKKRLTDTHMDSSENLIKKSLDNLLINSYKEVPIEFYSFAKLKGFPLFGEQLTISGIYKCLSKYFHDDLLSMIMNYI
jgi:hypothetical protein